VGRCFGEYSSLDNDVPWTGRNRLVDCAEFLESIFRTESMELPKEAVLLRIFIGEGDRFEGAPLYEQIVLKARAAGLAGATVLRGPLGYGKSSHLHTAKILRLSLDLPTVIEIVDRDENSGVPAGSRRNDWRRIGDLGKSSSDHVPRREEVSWGKCQWQ
jgi:uncharacterized protein